MNLSHYTHSLLITAALTSAAAFVSMPVQAREAVKCDTIYNQVQASIVSEPAKVLVIVEKEIRANETCACEIVKASIQASRASLEMINEIKTTAIAAAPAQEEVIKACIESLTNVKVRPSGKEVVTTSGKDVIVDPPLVGQGDDNNNTSSGDDDYYLIPPDIRGVYLIQPAAAGVFIVSDRTDDRRDGDRDDRRRNNPPRRPVPQSPSNATP